MGRADVQRAARGHLPRLAQQQLLLLAPPHDALPLHPARNDSTFSHRVLYFYCLFFWLSTFFKPILFFYFVDLETHWNFLTVSRFPFSAVFLEFTINSLIF